MQDTEKPRTIRLWRWMLIRHRDSSYRFIGHDIAKGNARISSPLVSVDPEWECAVTESGRLYRLVGHDGPGIQELRMLDFWQRRFGVSDDDIEDVTLEDAALDLARPANARPA